MLDSNRAIKAGTEHASTKLVVLHLAKFKGALNLIFDHLVLNWEKIRFFKINFYLGFRFL